MSGGSPEIPTAQPVAAASAGAYTFPGYAYPPRRASALGTVLKVFFGLFFALSLILNVILVVFVLIPFLGYYEGLGDHGGVSEVFHSGDEDAREKIALVNIDGLLAEGLTTFASRQIKQAARDEHVKAVVVVINSPGGTLTASDRLYKELCDLRDGKWPGQQGPKPLVAALESVAASGGYYIAVPAQLILAQPTTITGSIGVYANFLDLSRVPEKWGIDMETLKRGELKGMSMFRKLEPAEREHLEQIIEHAYTRFMEVVNKERKGKLQYGLRQPIPSTLKKLADGSEYIRRLADGGVFTAEQAKQFGLVDGIGYLEDAIAAAKSSAALTRAKVVSYKRPFSLWDAFLDAKSDAPGHVDLGHVPGFTVQPWYLTPGFELSGVKIPLRN
ncbi:MAG: hypothetical protein C4297_08435 [Gemmataceae bacterium]